MNAYATRRLWLKRMINTKTNAAAVRRRCATLIANRRLRPSFHQEVQVRNADVSAFAIPLFISHRCRWSLRTRWFRAYQALRPTGIMFQLHLRASVSRKVNKRLGLRTLEAKPRGHIWLLGMRERHLMWTNDSPRWPQG